jgi:hypothetical protein
MTWEGYVSLNTERPRQRDIIIQHWYTSRTKEVGDCQVTTSRYYIVRIYANGDGWDVFVPIHSGIEIQPTLDAIT